ncbi:branched-chain amino acid transport system II carrier protein [Thermoactinomyces mirandus]|uniref:Branched-chain amino acid transport system carrier protein n=1 Tax=Thermoactinomyces mirandus TaxID=2756294 RepID=A0A7W2ASB9_9BACL|nr:branched-chain amino acid transport system II carrier protein [Thermoactinomyces mirandus]MBA4602316.1 branched-chain amino acid transport system II carrier protein [Thermoactinomyces mirandus]
MSNSVLTNRKIITIGLMLFSLFFGAGNLIFPPLLGQEAGKHVFIAMLGFFITGIGLPLLAVIAVGLSENGLQSMASRVHPLFGLILGLMIYLSIGPFFGIPRTGTVSFEMGLSFLPESITNQVWALPVFTIVYFLVTFWFGLNPSKLIDRIGKILTPSLLLLIVILFVQGLLNPLGDLGQPTGDYVNSAFSRGFIEGYLTMDTLGALVFGGMVVASIQGFGVSDRKQVATTTFRAGLIAVSLLALVYFALAYLGATSQQYGMMENGGEILTLVANVLFSSYGTLILGGVVVLACLTTSIGLSTAVAHYLNQVFPHLSYRQWLLIVILFSAVVANIGLTQLIAISVPVLGMLYPVAIVLILLSSIDPLFKGYRAVYVGGLGGAFLVSLLELAVKENQFLDSILSWVHYIPLFDHGIGWLIPAILGSFVGYGIEVAMAKKTALSLKEQ